MKKKTLKWNIQIFTITLHLCYTTSYFWLQIYSPIKSVFCRCESSRSCHKIFVNTLTFIQVIAPYSSIHRLSLAPRLIQGQFETSLISWIHNMTTINIQIDQFNQQVQQSGYKDRILFWRDFQKSFLLILTFSINLEK